MRVFRSLHTYTPGTIEGWLHRITTNLFLDQARRKQRIRFDALSDEARRPAPERLPTPDVAQLDRMFDADIERALATSLPPDFRAAVVLCDVEGLTYEEIADVLGPQARHRPLPHPPRPRAAALRARPPRPGRRAHPLRRPGPDALRPGVGHVIGHLGSRVSALVDGQLAPEDAERAWSHVHTCPACRRLVEHEGWVKTRLAGLSFGAASAPDHLKGARSAGAAARAARAHAGGRPAGRCTSTRTAPAATPGSSRSAAAPSVPRDGRPRPGHGARRRAVHRPAGPGTNLVVPTQSPPAVTAVDRAEGLPVASPTGAETP